MDAECPSPARAGSCAEQKEPRVLEQTLGKARPRHQCPSSWTALLQGALSSSSWLCGRKSWLTMVGDWFLGLLFTVPSCRCGHALNQMPLGGRSLMTHQGEEWGMIPLRQGGCQGTWMHGHCKTQTWAGFALLQTAVQAKQQRLQLHRPYCCIVKQLTII